MPSLIIRDRVFPSIVRLLGSRQLFPVGRPVREANHVRQVCHADPWNSILFPEFRGKEGNREKNSAGKQNLHGTWNSHSKNEIRLRNIIGSILEKNYDYSNTFEFCHLDRKCSDMNIFRNSRNFRFRWNESWKFTWISKNWRSNETTTGP